MTIDQYKLKTDPYYQPLGSEVTHFEAAYQDRMPMMLKGPTGCGKTRFIEHMAYRLDKPLITVSCHEAVSYTHLPLPTICSV